MFDSIRGNRRTKENLAGAVLSDRISHCYLFYGEKGLGKRRMAKEFAKAMLCESENKPCGQCRMCRQVEKDECLDVIYMTHESKNTFGVDDVRDGFRTLEHSPNNGRKKIYILDDCELMNAQAQNAMLKTIEEPPEFVCVLLLCDNRELMLPTVLSRCVEVPMMPVTDKELMEELKAQNLDLTGMEDYVADFAGGNIGRAKRFLADEAYRDKFMVIDRVLKGLPDMNMDDIRQAVADIGTEKEDMPVLISRMQVVFGHAQRDKALGNRGLGDAYAYSDFPRIFDEIEHFHRRLAVNVNTELSLELLLADLRPEHTS